MKFNAFFLLTILFVSCSGNKAKEPSIPQSNGLLQLDIDKNYQYTDIAIVFPAQFNCDCATLDQGDDIEFYMHNITTDSIVWTDTWSLLGDWKCDHEMKGRNIWALPTEYLEPGDQYELTLSVDLYQNMCGDGSSRAIGNLKFTY